MYFFDPQQGNRRQALFRDKLNKYVNRTGDMIEGKAEEFSNRAYGTVHMAKSAMGMNADKDRTASTTSPAAGTTTTEPVRPAA